MKKLDAVTSSIGEDLMKCLFEMMVSLRTPWSITPKEVQQNILDGMRAEIDKAVQNGIRRIIAADQVSLVGQLGTVTAKETVKAVVMFPRESDTLFQLIDRIGSKIVVVLADPADHTKGMDAFKPEDDQKKLPLEE